MSGLNFLLWTIGALLILGAVAFVVACIYDFYARKRAMEAMIARDKKATIESIIRAIREKPDEIIHWDVEDLPNGGLRVGGHIDFVSPNPEKDKPK